MEEARSDVKRFAVKFCEAYPAIVETHRKLVADPDGVSSAAVAKRGARKRKVSGGPKAEPKSSRARTRVSDHEASKADADFALLRDAAAASSSAAAPPFRTLRPIRSDEEQMYGRVAVEEQDLARPGLLEDIATEVERQLCVFALEPESTNLDEGPLSF